MPPPNELPEGAEWLAPDGPEGPLLRVVRRIVVVAFLLLLAAAPVLHVAIGGIKTSSSVPLPVPTWRAFRYGSLMKDAERHFKELSPLTYLLRGFYNEWRFELGMLHNPRVIRGDDGWMYLRETVRGSKAAIDGARAKRRADLELVRQLAERVGLQLLVVVAPDKTSVYPEHLRPGQLDEARRGLYPAIQETLAAAGCAALDVQRVLLDHKRQHADELLFHKADTHWTGRACDVVADALRAELDRRGWLPAGPRLQLETRVKQQPAVPDLVSMLGMRTATPEGMESPWSTVRALQVQKEQFLVQVREVDGGRKPLSIEQPEAEVALCGTSYSGGYFQFRLAAALGVPVDTRGAMPAGSTFGGLTFVVGLVGSGTLKPKVLVWEFVERDFLWGWVMPPELEALLRWGR